MTLPNENCPTFFSCQTDLKCSGECTKRINMTTKNEALELARELEESARSYRAGEGGPHINVLISSVTILRSQAAEIEKLRESYQSACLLVADMHEAAMGGVMGPVLGVVEDVAALRAERDQLKAKNEKLIAWLGSNMTFYDVDSRCHTQHPNIPVLASVSKRIWYHATDNQLDYPFSQVVMSALKENT